MTPTTQKGMKRLQQPIESSAMPTIVQQQSAVGMLMRRFEPPSLAWKTIIPSAGDVPPATTVTLQFDVSFNVVCVVDQQTTPHLRLLERPRWRNPEYRHAYMESSIAQGVAWQIRINREKRKLSQTELAAKIGSRQSSISRAEDTTYGSHSLETLVKIANAFDCALQVRLIPYSTLARDSEDLSPEALYTESYDEEIAHGHQEIPSISADARPNRTLRAHRLRG